MENTTANKNSKTPILKGMPHTQKRIYTRVPLEINNHIAKLSFKKGIDSREKQKVYSALIKDFLEDTGKFNTSFPQHSNHPKIHYERRKVMAMTFLEKKIVNDLDLFAMVTFRDSSNALAFIFYSIWFYCTKNNIKEIVLDASGKLKFSK